MFRAVAVATLQGGGQGWPLECFMPTCGKEVGVRKAENPD